MRSFPLGEGDRLISFLSRTQGRLRGVAAGARKPKSKFGSTLELLSYVRISFYERENRDLVRINNCELIESFLDVQKDYGSGLALALISEISEAVLEEAQEAEASFRLLLVAARALKSKVNYNIMLSYFALWTVRLGGWLPALDRCASCKNALPAGGYLAENGIFCMNCRQEDDQFVSTDTAATASRMLKNKLDASFAGTLGTTSIVALRNLMLNMIERRVEKTFRTRKLLNELEGIHA